MSHDELILEILRFKKRLKAAGINLEVNWTALDILTFIKEWDFTEMLPMLSFTIRLFLTVCISVATCETL